MAIQMEVFMLHVEVLGNCVHVSVRAKLHQMCQLCVLSM